MGLTQFWGPAPRIPYQWRFEPLLADGGGRLVPASGDAVNPPESLAIGRLLRCDFSTDPLSRFYGTRSFGMDPGVPRETNNVPYTVPAILNITATFTWDFRMAVAHDIFHFFLNCNAGLRLYIEEFDQASNFMGATIPAQFNVVNNLQGEGFLPSSVFRTIPITTTTLTARIHTTPAHFYRVWTDAFIGMIVHGGGIVRFNVGVNAVTTSFSTT